jgi:WD40 repeat protein
MPGIWLKWCIRRIGCSKIFFINFKNKTDLKGELTVSRYFIVLILLIHSSLNHVLADTFTEPLFSFPSEEKIVGHNSKVNDISWSPDGRFFMSSAGGLKIWNAITFEEVFTINEVSYAAAWSPDSRFIASGADKTLKIWDVNTREETRLLSGHTGYISSIDWSPDGRFIVSGGGFQDNTIKIWNAATGIELITMAGHTNYVNSVAWSPNGSAILSGSEDGTIKIWDAVTGTELRALAGHSDLVKAAIWSSDGKFIFSGGGRNNNTVKKWDAITGKELLTFSGHSWIVSAVAFSPDGRFIVSGSYDHTVKIWDTNTGLEIRTLLGHTDRVNAVSLSPDGRFIISGSSDNTLHVWDVAAGEKTHDLGYKHQVSSLALSPNGDWLVSASRQSGELKIWSTATGTELRTLPGSSSPGLGRTVDWSPNGHSIISTGFNNTLKVWNAFTGENLRTFSGNTRGNGAVAWSPNGKFIAYGADRTLSIWDAVTGIELYVLAGHNGGINAISWSPDARFVVSGSGDQTLKTWNATTGELVRTLTGHNSEILAVAWSPDSRFIVSGSKGIETALKLWDANTGEEIRTLTGYGLFTYISSVAWSPDGRLIASGSSDKTIKLWEASTGKKLHTFMGHTSTVNDVAFSPDGLKIYSGSSDRTIKVWDVNPCAPGTTPPPPAPVMTVTTVGDFAALSWEPMDKIDSYVFYFAPYSNPVSDYTINNIQSVDIGKTTSLSGELPPGLEVFVAIRAKNCSGEGDFSNVGVLQIPQNIPAAPPGYYEDVVPPGFTKMSMQDVWARNKAFSYLANAKLSSPEEREQALLSIGELGNVSCSQASCVFNLPSGLEASYIYPLEGNKLIDFQVRRNKPEPILQSYNPVHNSRRSVSGATCPRNQKALILAPGYDTFDFDDPDGSKKLNNALLKIYNADKFVLEEIGYTVEIKEGLKASKADLEDIKAGKYGVIIITAHGNKVGGFQIEKICNTCEYDPNYFGTSRLHNSSDLWLDVKSSWWDTVDSPDTFIAFNSCSSFSNTSDLRLKLEKARISAIGFTADTSWPSADLYTLNYLLNSVGAKLLTDQTPYALDKLYDGYMFPDSLIHKELAEAHTNANNTFLSYDLNPNYIKMKYHVEKSMLIGDDQFYISPHACETVPTESRACNAQVQQGSDEAESHTIELGKTSGIFSLSYDMKSTYKDQIKVYYEGQLRKDTGCVLGEGSFAFTYSGGSSTVRVDVIPNCDGEVQNTSWSFTPSCP